MTVLHYAGVGLFAEVARIDEDWPKAEGSSRRCAEPACAARRAVLGADGIVPATDRIFGPLDTAVERAPEWIAGRE